MSVARSGVLAAALVVACTSLVADEGRARGLLTGAVSIGPICPVERAGEPCAPSPDLFAQVRLLVHSATGRRLARVDLDGSGRYRVELPAGSYLVKLEHRLGIDRGAGERFRAVQVAAGETMVLDFAIDTGIR